MDDLDEKTVVAIQVSYTQFFGFAKNCRTFHILSSRQLGLVTVQKSKSVGNENLKHVLKKWHTVSSCPLERLYFLHSNSVFFYFFPVNQPVLDGK